MIENERQLQAAQEAIRYWKSTIPQTSWLAGERARKEIMHLRRQIAEYEKRNAAESEPTGS